MFVKKIFMKIILLTIISAMMVSCVSYIDKDANIGLTKSEYDTKEVVWFSFDSIVRDSTWLFSEDMQYRVKKCQIPENQIHRMPTDTLIDRCLKYPFLIDFLSRDDFNCGVESVLKNFNGFGELESRQDGIYKLWEKYLEYDVVKIAENSLLNGGGYELLELAFLELYCARTVNLLKNITVEKRFSEQVKINIGKKLQYPNVYDWFMLNTSTQLISSMGESIKKDADTPDRDTTITTMFGKVVHAKIVDDMCEYGDILKNSIIESFQNTYPLITIIGDPSVRYNCHSYAWYLSYGGETTCVIESSDLPNTPNGSVDVMSDNVSAFWTDGRYAQSTITSFDRIFYYRGDHSAIKASGTGMCESKWGVGPLCRHAYFYGPESYYMNYRNVYKEFFTNYPTMLLHCSNGENEVEVGQYVSYYRTTQLPIGCSSNFLWTVNDNRDDSDVLGLWASISNPTNSSANISINRRGLYTVKLHHYHPNRGELEFTWEAVVY